MNLILFNILNDFKLSQNQGSFKSQCQGTLSFGDILGLLLIQFFTSRGEDTFKYECLEGTKQVEQIAEDTGEKFCNSDFNFQLIRSVHEPRNDNSVITEAINSLFEQGKTNEFLVLELTHLMNKWVANQGFDTFERPQLKIPDGENVNVYRQMNFQKAVFFNIDAFMGSEQRQSENSQVINSESGQINKIPESIEPEMRLGEFTHFDLNEMQMLSEKKLLEDLSGSENTKREKFHLRVGEHQSQDERIKHDRNALEKSQPLGNHEHEQAKNDFDSSFKLKKEISHDIGAEKIIAKNFNSVNVTSFDQEIRTREFNLPVKVQDIPEVLKDFVLKSDIIDREVIILKVEPKEIGEVVIKISEGERGVRILFEVKNLEAKQIIESGFENLKTMLESNNVNLEKIGTLIAGGSFTSDDLNSLSPEREKFHRRSNRKKIFDSNEIVKIYGGSLIEAII
ncbi:MAG: hypothetical protein RMJ81_02185 [Candidatus Kryptonium sp.]|nr:hypothetical protein [Candidatus Kryptonium sp.]MDW8108446.1 hypothetical protein [Candidatus Kryptonium sp.]